MQHAFLCSSANISFILKYRWIIDPPLEVTVPSKHTPWPDAPPELPSTENLAITIQDHAVKHSTKTRSPRSKRRSKRKHDTRSVDTQVSARHTEQNWNVSSPRTPELHSTMWIWGISVFNIKWNEIVKAEKPMDSYLVYVGRHTYHNGPSRSIMHVGVWFSPKFHKFFSSFFLYIFFCWGDWFYGLMKRHHVNKSLATLSAAL